MDGASRSSRWPTVAIGAAVLLLGLGLLGGLYFGLLSRLRAAAPPPPSGSPPPTAEGKPKGPGCMPARVGVANLGEFAWTASDQLLTYSLRDCTEKVVVASNASAPVRFSPDGRWLAFGRSGEVVPASGGASTSPLGSSIVYWEWSPVADSLVGITKERSVVLGGPGETVDALLPPGSVEGRAVFSPDGKQLAIERTGRGIQVLDISSGRAKTVLPEGSKAAAPRVAGWSPDGQWVTYWRGPVKHNGSPLDAVPATGGAWVNLYEPVLPSEDLISACGDGLAITIGPGADLNTGKQIVVTDPPDWSFANVSNDYGRSWFWPSCSPNGRWVATTDSLNGSGSSSPRALWLIATDGSSKQLLIPGTGGAIEYPRWSSSGSVILAVVRGGNKGWASNGKLLLAKIDPKTGDLKKSMGPFLNIGAAPGPGGDERWWSTTDWYRPSK